MDGFQKAVMAEREACARLVDSMRESLKEIKLTMSINGLRYDDIIWDAHPFDIVCNRIAHEIRNREAHEPSNPPTS